MATPHANHLKPPARAVPPLRLTPQVILGITALVPPGYLAFCLSGFGHPSGIAEPLPIYIYFAALLIALQYAISKQRGLAHFLSLAATSSVPLVYVGVFAFTDNTPHGLFSLLTRNVLTLVVLQAIAYAVFIVDAVNRHRRMVQAAQAAGSAPVDHVTAAPADSRSQSWLQRHITLPNYVAFASDLVGFTALTGILAGALRLLDDPHTYITSHVQDVLRLPIVHALYTRAFPDVAIDSIRFDGLTETLPFDRGGHLELWQADSIVFFGVAFLAAVALVVIIALVVVENNAVLPRSLRQLLKVFVDALGQVAVSLRRMLMAVVWFIPALLIALFSSLVDGHFQYEGTHSVPLHQGAWHLFVPDGREYLSVLAVVLIGALAVLFVIVAVSIAETEPAILRNTRRILRNTAQTALLAAPVIIYGLAALNTLITFSLRLDMRTPFRAGDAGLVALALVILVPLLGGPTMRNPQKPSAS